MGVSVIIFLGALVKTLKRVSITHLFIGASVVIFEGRNFSSDYQEHLSKKVDGSLHNWPFSRSVSGISVSIRSYRRNL